MQQRYNQGGARDSRPPAGGAGAGSGGIEKLLCPPAQKFRYFADNARAPRQGLLDKDAQDVAKELATLPAS